MGGLFSSDVDRVDDIDNGSSSSYRYPPASGPFFADHFIMGGSKFNTTQPESYLFGENADLNFLSPKPVPFPYPSPHGNEPTKTLCSLVHLRKDSLKLIKCEDSGDENTFHIEFLFDADVKCTISIHYLATEDLASGLAVYTSKDHSMTSPRFYYPKGAGQLFSNALRHRINPKRFTDEEMSYNPLTSSHIPIVIQIDVDDEEFIGHSNITLAILEKTSDETYSIKPIKQKQMVDGLCFLLQEIYGIENKASNRKNGKEVDEDDAGEDDNVLECVICMSDHRDTLILPCRHLCLCRACADSLRYQSSNCPICRSPFHALLQIRAYTKKSSPWSGSIAQGSIDNEEDIPGYQEIPLVEALNGRIAPDNIPEEAVVRMQHRRSSSLRSSGRRNPSRASSARSQRRIERAVSAGSARQSRPRSSQAECTRRDAQLESYDNAASVASFEEVARVPAQVITEDTSKNKPVLGDEGNDEVPELQIHVDVSLPGTPLGSENSGRSSRGDTSSSNAPATTPTCVRLEEQDLHTAPL